MKQTERSSLFNYKSTNLILFLRSSTTNNWILEESSIICTRASQRWPCRWSTQKLHKPDNGYKTRSTKDCCRSLLKKTWKHKLIISARKLHQTSIRLNWPWKRTRKLLWILRLKFKCFTKIWRYLKCRLWTVQSKFQRQPRRVSSVKHLSSNYLEPGRTEKQQ